MKLTIPRDIFDNPHPPRLFLCNTGKKKIGELPAYDVSLDAKWNAYSELGFSIDRKYTDMLTGESKTNQLFDLAEGLRKVYAENIGYFVIQDPDTTYADKDSKSLVCFSSEYETASKTLENFKINTGEVDSAEVIHLSSQYGENYTIDTPYTQTTGAFDPYESYYIRDYKDSQSYVYEQVSISTAEEYATYDGSTVEKTLYIKKYPNVRFYWPSEGKEDLSLLHIIFKKIPGWEIGNVDASLWRKERTFDESRIAVYDFMMNDMSETFKCVVEWDTLTNRVNFYEEAEDGITADNTVQTRFDTDVYITRDNLANEINIKYSTDDIKTKLKVSGADGFDIREVNCGKNYIMNLDYYHNTDWMEQDLYEAYSDYLLALNGDPDGITEDARKGYAKLYNEQMQGWVAANNKYNELMNAVPAEGNVVLVGDEFKKLYCIKTPIDTAYIPQTLTDVDIETDTDGKIEVLYSDAKFEHAIDKTTLEDQETFVVQGYQVIYVSSSQKFKCIRNIALGTALNGTTQDDGLPAENGLIPMLTLYHVNEDIEGNKSDNILLRLKNNQDDVATIRIYNAGTESSPEYKIQRVVISASTGIESDPITYTMEEWITGQLTASKMNLDGYKVNYIGIMGAYLVLAKDETKEENIEDYGVMLLREKHDVYTTVFQTQTEAMLSQERYRCIVNKEMPLITSDMPNNIRWLDSDSNPLVLYEYHKSENKWVQITGEVSSIDQKNYENYQRYIDNFEKLKVVQNVLVKKEREAEYCLNGYVVPGMRIDPSDIKSDAPFFNAAQKHFDGESVTPYIDGLSNALLPIYRFTTSYDGGQNVYAVYLKGMTPYVAYFESQGVCQAKMDKLSQLSNFETFFSPDQLARLSPLIREDEFSDSNFLLTGYESEEERLKITNELMETADKELKTLSQPSLEFSMNMANIIALPEFEPIKSQFELGNFIRIELRPGLVKRSRLLNAHLSFNDLSDFSAEFGNLVTTKSEIDKHADLLKQAVTAGKKVAVAADDWQKAVDKSNKLEEDIANGLRDAALEVGRANGQSIVWDSSGIWGRKLVDGTTDQYLPEQFRIINNKLVFSNDGFQTSKALFGEYKIGDETRWGALAEYITAQTIEGKTLIGGSIQIGTGDTKFIVNENGEVNILVGEQEKYASSSAMEVIDDAYRYRIDLSYSDSTIFSDIGDSCTITCSIYDNRNQKDVTQDFINNHATFSWRRTSYNGMGDTEWNEDDKHKNQNINTILITAKDDVTKNAQFSCDINISEENLKILQGGDSNGE